MFADISKPNSAKPEQDQSQNAGITWGSWAAVIMTIVIYLLAQFLGAEIISIYPALQHWSHQATLSWINNSIIAQFFYVLFAEGLSLLIMGAFIRWRKGSWRALGLKQPKIFQDMAWAYPLQRK